MALKNKCVFLDRDGVLNEDRPDYSYHLEHFRVLPGVPLALRQLKNAGYLLIVVTNQSGISKGVYTQQDMEACHHHLQQVCGGLIDHFYFSPYHPDISESLGRKPGSLLFEKGIAKFGIEPTVSWMVGDRERDLVPARQLGMRTILIGNDAGTAGKWDFTTPDLASAARQILSR